MADQIADKLLARHHRMKNQRAQFEQTWQDIAEVIIPRKARFTRHNQPNETRGEKQTQLIFDAVPALALDRFAAAVHSLVVPRNQVWHKIKSSIEELNNSIPVQRYFEELNKRLFSARYSGNFDNQVHEGFYDLGAFATMALFIGDTGRAPILYRSVPMWQAYFAENQFGVVDLMHREYPLTARNAVKEFAPERLPDIIRRCAHDTPEREFMFLCCVMPREDMDSERMDAKGMPFVQYDISIDGKSVVEESGHRVFPYAVSRYSVTPGDTYGRGPAELVLPDIKMLNEMNKTTMQAAQLRALPPLLAQADGVLSGVRLSPAAINYGGVDSQGRAMVQPLNTGGDIGLGLEMMDQKRHVIQDAFWNLLFQVLVDQPNMTATEAMLRAQEKGALLAPTASRIESEYLARIIDNELDILHFNGALPEPPQELLEAGGGYQLEYESPMARARRAEEGVAILRTFEQLTPLAQINPGVLKRFNMDASVKILAEVNGYPAKGLYSDDEMQAINEQAAQEAQLQQLLAAAPVAAGAAKDLASAQRIAQQPPSAAVPA